MAAPRTAPCAETRPLDTIMRLVFSPTKLAREKEKNRFQNIPETHLIYAQLFDADGKQKNDSEILEYSIVAISGALL